MTRFFTVLLLLLPFLARAQYVSGTVENVEGEPLAGANLVWINTTAGVSTGQDGSFKISDTNITDHRLVVSYTGFATDTIATAGRTDLEIRLRPVHTLQEVEVQEERPGTFISSLEPAKTEIITQKELTKSACCDLAGCFNTQSSVEPTTTNIVTNARELRILGLAGVYNQVLIDGMPLINGLTYTYGISTIPGTLVDNIYISKGANSVLQGFEGMAGQINVELKGPDEGEQLLLNGYINSFLEKQFNVNYSHRWKKWSTLLAAHTTQPASKFDRDSDTFLDLPLLTRYSVYNKWKYGKQEDWGWHSQIGFRFVNEERIGGQMDFDPGSDQGTTNHYGQTVQFSQPEFYTKTGHRFNDNHHLVLIASGFHQNQLSYFGTARYDARQTNGYAKVQYELSWSGDHDFRTGVSYRSVNREEKIAFTRDTLNRTYDGTYLTKERIPGLFAENIFNWNDRKITLITGIRLDNHNTFGWFVTPRALFKYNFSDRTTARISAGTGWRTANVFSENPNLLASSREVIFTGQLKPEQAVNYGANVTHQIMGEDIETQITLDFYRTAFSNQIFPDYDRAPAMAYISNFTGTSVSNSFQAEVGLQFFDRVGVKAAYNYLDVYRIVQGGREKLPFIPTHRITGTGSYQPLNKSWNFDMNVHWYGSQQLARSDANPPEYQLPVTSRPYIIVNAQIKKNWKRFEFYGGCENILDFRQEQPILSWQDPFGPYFDTSTAWGPTRGREIYFGVRYKIK